MKRNICFRAIMSSLALLVMICITIPCVAKGNKKERPQINTYEEAVTAFNKIFNASPEWTRQFEVYPVNRLYVDTKNSNMCFVKKDGTVRRWKYLRVSGDNNCKSVDNNSVGDFLKWLHEDLGIQVNYFETLAQQLDTDYKAKIAANPNTNAFLIMFISICILIIFIYFFCF